MGIKLSNNAFATLAAGINSSATSITVTSGQGARFPTLSAGDYFYATLVDTSNNLEIVKCTARSTDVLTVVRAQESTTARAYSTGDRIEIRITAQTFVDAAGTDKLPLAGGTITGSLGIGTPASVLRPLHLAATSSIEAILEQTNAKVDGRKWNHLVSGGDSVTNANYTLRLLNDAANATTLTGFDINGTTGKFTTGVARAINAASVPTGSIIQVKETMLGGGNFQATSSTAVNTGFSATITPQFSTSKVLHIVRIGFYAICDGRIYIYRNGSVASDSLGDSSRTAYDWYNDMAPICLTYLDSPATTSAITYSIWAAAMGCGNTLGVGSPGDFNSSWVMMEVAA